jgi:hypothetical protein
MNRWPALPLAIATAVLAGCGEMPVGEPTIDVEAAQARAARIDVWSTTRDEVHALMGEPWLADDAFGVEVYRLQGKQRQLLIILGVPMPNFSEALAAYSLVTYGADGVVSALDSDYARSGGTPGPPTLVLRAGEFEFVHGFRDTLSVSLERYLEVRPAAAGGDACTVLVGGERSRRPDTGPAWFCVSYSKLSVDGAQERDLRLMEPSVIPYDRGSSRSDCERLGGSYIPAGGPDRGACVLTTRARYPLTLPAGTHVLHFDAGSDADVTSTLDCKAGQVSFATLYGKFVRCSGIEGGTAQVSKGTGASVSFTERPPAAEDEPGVVLYGNGEWLHSAAAAPP